MSDVCGLDVFAGLIALRNWTHGEPVTYLGVWNETAFCLSVCHIYARKDGIQIKSDGLRFAIFTHTS
jgi:hypothetical protein